jgi:hypothetical protein
MRTIKNSTLLTCIVGKVHETNPRKEDIGVGLRDDVGLRLPNLGFPIDHLWKENEE